MSRAQPVGTDRRLAAYRRTSGDRPTPAQRQRLRHKLNRARRREGRDRG